MKVRVLSAALTGALLALCGLAIGETPWLIWNRTGSAPIGLYRLSGEAVAPGKWVSVSAESEAARWAQERGFIGRSWPLLKRIAALPGAEICREGAAISIDGAWVAVAREHDSFGREMPVWSGCHTLQKDELFLLNAHPRSLDGRYFGPTRVQDVEGVALPVFTFER
ncbi:MAG: hypothetical protein B7X53_00050 [Hyphomonas sp. 34-62-18]|nr:S26 family signal peptidase [Hyphomonas sp. 34-62-18]OZB19392.1 MAG: hypothetical protein B7X53_00050 [Hyphomonas sp. 34-62-18]